ncbi:hypothetical protein [Deinococcus sp. AJ005]|uniref:hypothetical protein n=1 Tax=Deinococcus sp. AJ005 TaxID=2652443 RepID=UPI00125CB011|nr:hypothetical protein [Deinococcus sp. AJ005]QFP76358.1 hypothetical protein DAAJ005_07745 [Deinococcus sp. AJ005]
MRLFRWLALLLLLLGFAGAQSPACPACVWVGRAQIALPKGLGFTADLTLTPSSQSSSGTVTYDLRAVIHPISAGADASRSRMRPRVPEVVYTQKQAAFFSLDTGRYDGRILAQYPVVGAKDNEILRPGSNEALLWLLNFDGAKFSADGSTVQGKDENMTFSLRRLPALSPAPAAAPACATCAWSGTATATSRLGTALSVALTLTPSSVQGSVVRYRVAGAFKVPSGVPQQEPGRKDCRTTYAAPFTLDAEQYVEVDSVHSTYRGVITAQAALITRCDNKTLPATDEVVLMMTVGKVGVDQPLAGGAISGTVNLAPRISSRYALTRLNAGQTPTPVAAAPTLAVGGCGGCRWVGSASGKAGRFGVPYTAAITLIPAKAIDANRQRYTADVTLTLTGVGTAEEGCRATPRGGAIHFTTEANSMIDTLNGTALLGVVVPISLNVTCTGLLAGAAGALGQDAAQLIPTGTGAGLSLSENGTRLKGSDRNGSWDLKAQR